MTETDFNKRPNGETRVEWGILSWGGGGGGRTFLLHLFVALVAIELARGTWELSLLVDQPNKTKHLATNPRSHTLTRTPSPSLLRRKEQGSVGNSARRVYCNTLYRSTYKLPAATFHTQGHRDCPSHPTNVPT